MAEPIQSKACDKCGAPAIPGAGPYTTTTHLKTCAALAFFEALPFDAKPAEAPHPVTDQFGNIVGHSRTPHWSRAEKHPVTGEVYLRRAGDPIVERPALSDDATRPRVIVMARGVMFSTEAQAIDRFGPEARGPDGSPENATAAVIDALRAHRNAYAIPMMITVA